MRRAGAEVEEVGRELAAAARSPSTNDLLTMVHVALGNTPVGGCQPGDANGNGNGQITVDEIVTAVNNALSGCRVG